MNQSLGVAILKKDKFAIEDILKAGADPNALIPGEEFAPIHLGAGTSKSITQLLLKYGADPNARTHEGSTPLHIAASWGKSRILKLLLKYGADISIRDNEELDALGVAGKYVSQDCLHILRNHERKHEIDIQGKKHGLSNAFNQIEIHFYLNRIKLFSTCINGISKMFQLPGQNDLVADKDFQFTDQNYQFAEDGPITVETYKTEEDDNGYELKKPGEDILTLSRSQSLISLPAREEFSATIPHEQVQQRNRNNEEQHLSYDQHLDTKIRQESGVYENTNAKIELKLINNRQQDRFRNDLLKIGSNQRRKETLEKPSAKTFFHPSLSSQQAQEIHDSDNNFHTRQRIISPKDFNDVLTQDASQDSNSETVYVERGSRQTSTLPHTEYHLELESETDHDGRDQTKHQFLDIERNEESLKYEQWNDHSRYQSPKMAKKYNENKNSSSLETEIVKSVTQNKSSVPCSCDTHIGIQTNPVCKPERRMCRKCWNGGFCTESDENLHSSQPRATVSDNINPDNISQMYKCAYAAQRKQEDPIDEIHIRSFDHDTETSDRSAKQKRFRKYSTNNLYLKIAASVNEKKGLPTEKLVSMKKAFRRIPNCRICLATKAMFARLKQKIHQ